MRHPQSWSLSLIVTHADADQLTCVVVQVDSLITTTIERMPPMNFKPSMHSSWVWAQHCCECGWAGVDLWIGGLFVGTWQQRGSVGAEGGGGAQAARGDGGLQQHLGVDTPLFTIVIK